MPRQRIQNQRSGSCEDGILIPKCKQRAYASSLATFASDFDCEPDQRLENVRIIFSDLAKNALKHPSNPISYDTCQLLHSQALDEGITKKIQALNASV